MTAYKQIVDKGLKPEDIAVYWELGAGQEGDPLSIPRYNDKTVHIFGTWGGASVSLLGSIDPNRENFGVLTDDDKTPITQSADGVPRVIVPNALSIKPVVTGGDETTEIIIAIMANGRRS